MWEFKCEGTKWSSTKCHKKTDNPIIERTYLGYIWDILVQKISIRECRSIRGNWEAIEKDQR